MIWRYTIIILAALFVVFYPPNSSKGQRLPARVQQTTVDSTPTLKEVKEEHRELIKTIKQEQNKGQELTKSLQRASKTQRVKYIPIKDTIYITDTVKKEFFLKRWFSRKKN